MLAQGFIQDLLSRVDVVEVVGRHVELKKAGINHKGLCPFHGEKSPSFIVSPSRQTYHCFGCGVHGDAIRFLTEHHGMAFMDAVRDLAQQVGMAVPENTATPEDQARAEAERNQRATLSEVLAKAGDHYRGALKASPRAVAYLKKRGLTGQVAARFGLGYAPEGWRTLAGVFPRYDDPLLADSGLVITSGGDGTNPAEEQKRYDRFRDRIMFPIRSVKGEVIGFGGRVLDVGEPKYLNSPETAVFHKGQELYGLYEARQGLRAKSYALVEEGYMDVVALAQWGYANAVATLGTACTDEHVSKLFRFTDTVIFSFDGDAAGRRAAGRALEAALPHASDTRSVRFLFLPSEHDPDSFIRELGPEAFEAVVAQAVPLSAQLIAHAGADCDLATAEGRSKMLAQAGPLVALLPEGLLREQVVQALAQQGGMAAEVLQAHWARRSAGRRPARTEATTPDGPESPPDDGTPPGMARPGSERGRGRGRFAAGGREGWAGRPRVFPMAGHRAPPQSATLLDRCAWLLARHTAAWLALPGDTHEFLAGQPAPYGHFFAGLERVLHDHGPITMPALIDELGRSDGESDDDLRGLLARLAGFHDVDDDEAPEVPIDAVLQRLRQQAVTEELKWLTESGELSDEATARRNALIRLTAELKRGPARPAPA
ncbi:MAG: DNA primase [Microbacteriaceae bacterium]|nr:DNA primase [Burkholderiaceae bacterium]